MSAQRPIDEADLHAFIDGQLDPERTPEVIRYLDEHPDVAARFQAYQLQTANLRSLFEGDRNEESRGGRKRFEISALRYAAVFVLTVIAGAMGWWLHGISPPTAVLAATFPREAAVAHAVYSPDVRHPVEVTAAQEAHLTSWLSRRLGISVRPPHLSNVGYELLGGRLVPSDNGPAAQFMYQDGNGKRLTLYVRTMQRANKETAFRYAREGEVSVFYWVDGPLGYALSGNLAKPDLLKVADAVYRDLAP